MTNQMIPIGKLFDIEKGVLQSTKCTPGDYDFITAAEDWKTHNEYSHECEALIFAAAASGSLGRAHYVDGKFTTSDLCYILTPKDEAKYPLNLSFYHFVFNSLRPTLVAATKSGTSKESINQTNLKKYEIPYFDIELQDLWIEKLKNTLGLKDLLGGELSHQQTLLKQLRQQILQEAIEGKLTADWRAKNPDVEPASELLKRIAAEKAQLVKDKKIKAQKPLPPITEEEKPFDLPQGWEWCRLGSLYEIVRGSSPRPKGDPRYWTNNRTRFHWITIADFTPYGSGGLLTDTKSFLTEDGAKKSRKIKEGDLLIACSGVGSVGRSIQSGINGYIYDGLLAIRNITDLVVRDYLRQFLLFKEAQIYDVASGANWLNINIEILSNYIIAIPPEEEMKQILSKLESVNILCNQLETQITQNQTHAEQLMQAVLKEAFRHNSQAEAADFAPNATAYTQGSASA